MMKVIGEALHTMVELVEVFHLHRCRRAAAAAAAAGGGLEAQAVPGPERRLIEMARLPLEHARVAKRVLVEDEQAHAGLVRRAAGAQHCARLRVDNRLLVHHLSTRELERWAMSDDRC